MSERADEHVAQPEPAVPDASPVPAFASALPGPAAALSGLGTRFEGVDRQVAARMVLGLGREHGNAAVARALDPRRRVESVTGFDLSDATVHEASPHAAAAGVDGLAHGTDVHLAPGVSAGTAHGDHVIAHELAHVVQQGTGRAAGGHRGALEADAESVAAQARTAGPPRPALAPLPPPRELAVQLFDPRYHRTSTVQSLEHSGFTPDEVGMIYASNWARDLSQAHPTLGNIILAWKTVKVAAYERRLTESEIAAFQTACARPLEVAALEYATTGSVDNFMNATTYGGYAFYEHMDNPVLDDPSTTTKDEAAEARENMQVALNNRDTEGLPDHIYISREYIKEMLFEAAKLAHPDLGSASTRSGQVAAESADMRSRLNPGPGVVTGGEKATTPVAEETSIEAQEHAGTSGGGGLSMAPAAYEKIGRAMHALQDFWSHSNFVERAIGVPEFQLGGLTTATFGADDKTHALAHKVRGAADEIDAEMPLVDRMSGRRATDPLPSEVDVGDESPVHHEDDLMDLVEAVDQIDDVALALPGNLWRGARRGWNRTAGSGFGGFVRGVAGAAEGAALAGTASVLGSKAGVTALRHFAEWLDEKTEDKQRTSGDFQAHGLLAKDQPGHDDSAFGVLKTARFELAHELSVAADEMVAGKMKDVVDAPDAAVADSLLLDIFDTLDSLIADAGSGHPLWGIVEAHRASAEAALNAYLAEQESGAAPAHAH